MGRLALLLQTFALTTLLLDNVGAASLDVEIDPTHGHIYGLSPAKKESQPGEDDRTLTSAKERFFTLVRFHPEVCEISPTMVGTCITSTDCTNRGGSNIGSCAKGFGVCCLLTLSATPQNPYVTVRDRAVILESGSGVTQSTYEIPKLEGSCQLLVEFLEFALQAPAAANGLCSESMRISGSVTVNNGFPICGTNLGQRIFLSYGRGERITLEFNTINGRYRLRVRHIMCSNTALLAPVNCLQHYVTSAGVVRSFSYGNSMVADQMYTVCIQDPSVSREIQWLECTEADAGVMPGLRSQFFLSNYFVPAQAGTSPPHNLGMTGHPCAGTSFVEVFGEEKHCGAKFTINTVDGQLPVKSIAKPFQLLVNVHGNSYIPPEGAPTSGYIPAFAFPVGATPPPPAPTPVCSEFGSASSGAQAFTGCADATAMAACMCTYMPMPTIPIVPADPVRTGFCLKYMLT